MTDQDTFDLILRGGTAVLPGRTIAADIGVRSGKVAAIGLPADAAAAEVVDCTGLHVLPGLIDTQVHFREPGLEHKEDLATGTASAAMGGITAVFDMPNTKPNLLTAQDMADKVGRATGRAHTDFAFYAGAADENAEALPMLERLPGCCGVKIFMGSSTGSLLVADDEKLEKVLRSGTRRVALHAEDEPRLLARKHLAEEEGHPRAHPVWRDVETALNATRRLLALARKTGRRVHVLHITTAEEMALLAANKDIATVEVLPQHLTMTAPECYERLGSLAQMNPPIREQRHQDALWQAISDGVVDCMGSDHAPHTLEEKAQPYPKSPSGLSGVQTTVPLMLNHVAAGKLTLERFVDLMSSGPNRIHGIAAKGRIALGYDADFTVVDLKAERTIEHGWIASKVGWTPFDGMEVTGWPIMTIVRGQFAMRDGVLVEPVGQPVRFQETLAG
ncbi:MAG: dihydroorotase [Pseudomonadota bacterium]